MRATAAGENAFEVRSDRGVPRIFRNGKVMPSRVFFGSFLHGGFKESWTTVPREFGYALDAGVPFFETHGELLWEGCDVEKTKAVNRKRADAFFAVAKPGQPCYMIVRLNCNPPEWWKALHPETRNIWNDESKIDGWIKRFPLQSLASEEYQRQVVKAVKETVAFYEAAYPGKMAGYHCGGLHTSEWVYDGLYRAETEGYDDSTRRGFRLFLKERYGSEGALQKAWNAAAVTFETADVPSHEMRCGDGTRFLRTRARDARLLDFNEYRTRLVSGTITRLARAVREAKSGRLTGFFFGYVTQGSWFGGGGRSGYLSAREVLDSQDVDFLCSPFNYNWRRVDQPLATQGLLGSIAAAGKLWLNEDDTATYLACRTNDGGPSMFSKCPTPESTADMLRRNLAYTYLNNHAIWWMDLNGAGWWDDPKIWETMKAFRSLEDDLLAHPVASRPEFAVVYDHRGALHFEGLHSKECAPPNFAETLAGEMNGLGAPFGVYLADDLVSGRAERLKMAVFPTSYALDGAGRQTLRNFASRNGAIFVWAPGYVDLGRDGVPSPSGVEMATGFEVRELPMVVTLAATATARGRERFGLPEKIGPMPRFGAPKIDVFAPVLSPVVKPGDEVLGVYTNGEPAVVLRMNAAGKPVVFCGTSRVAPELVRGVAEMSGVHFFAPKGTAVYSNGREFAVYAMKDGTVEIRPPTGGPWRDYLTGRRFEGETFTVPMRQGETILLRREK